MRAETSEADGRKLVRILTGPDREVIRFIHTRDETARPEPAKVTDERPLDAPVDSARVVELDRFATSECGSRTCTDFVLNDPAFGGLAILVNAVEGEPAFDTALAIAQAVRGVDD